MGEMIEFEDWLDQEFEAHRMFPDAGVYTAVHSLLYHYTLVVGMIDDRT